MSFWDGIGSALVGAGASLIGNILGSESTSDTNDTNLQIAQMNNEFNEEQMQKVLDYNTEMWNKENEYNTYSAIRERMEDAGLNPALMFTGGAGSVSNASSAQSTSPAKASEVGRQMPYDWDLSGVAESYASVSNANSQKELAEANSNYADAQARLSSLNADAREIMNKYAEKSLVQDIVGKMNENEYSTYRNMLMQDSYTMQLNRYNLENEKLKSDVGRNIAETVNLGLMASLSQKELSWFDAKSRAQVSQMAADTYLKYAQGSLSYKQCAEAVANTILITAKANGQKLDNWKANMMADDVINQAKLTTQSMYYESQSAKNSMFKNQVGKDALSSGYMRFTNTVLNPLYGILGIGVKAGK